MCFFVTKYNRAYYAEEDFYVYKVVFLTNYSNIFWPLYYDVDDGYKLGEIKSKPKDPKDLLEDEYVLGTPLSSQGYHSYLLDLIQIKQGLILHQGSERTLLLCKIPKGTKFYVNFDYGVDEIISSAILPVKQITFDNLRSLYIDDEIGKSFKNFPI